MDTATTTRSHTVIETPVGPLTVVSTGSTGGDWALAGLYFPQHLRRPAFSTFGRRTDQAFAEVREQLGEYFAGARTAFDVPLRPAGDAFRQRVWALLREIPYGETRTYGDLARDLGNPNLAQAVGHANALNPISIVVPCHRVIAADGSLAGFAGGLERKRFLLDLEAPPADRVGRLF